MGSRVSQLRNRQQVEQHNCNVNGKYNDDTANSFNNNNNDDFKGAHVDVAKIKGALHDSETQGSALKNSDTLHGERVIGAEPSSSTLSDARRLPFKVSTLQRQASQIQSLAQRIRRSSSFRAPKLRGLIPSFVNGKRKASAESEQPQQVEQQVSSDEDKPKESTEQPIVEQKVEISEPVSASVTNVAPHEQEAKVEVEQNTDSTAVVVDEVVSQPEKSVEVEAPKEEATLAQAPVTQESTPEAPKEDIKQEEAKPTPEVANDQHEQKENTEQPTVEQKIEISQPTPEISTSDVKQEEAKPTSEVSSDEDKPKESTEQPIVEQKVEISEPVSASVTNVAPHEQEAKVEVEQNTDSTAVVVDEVVSQPGKSVEVEAPKEEATLAQAPVTQESTPEAPKEDIKQEEAKPTPEVANDQHEQKENTEQPIVDQKVGISQPTGEQPETEGHINEPKESVGEPVSASSVPAETQQPPQGAAVESEPSTKDVVPTNEVTIPALQNGISDKTIEAENKQNDDHSAHQQEVAKEPQVQSEPSTQETVESAQN